MISVLGVTSPAAKSKPSHKYNHNSYGFLKPSIYLGLRVHAQHFIMSTSFLFLIPRPLELEVRNSYFIDKEFEAQEGCRALRSLNRDLKSGLVHPTHSLSSLNPARINIFYF